MNDTEKEIFYKVVAVIVVVCIAFILWFRLCGNISDDRGTIDAVRGSIQQSQAAAGEARESIESAEKSNQDSTETTGRIEESNRKLEESNSSIAGLIEQGESILESIRGTGEKDS